MVGRFTRRWAGMVLVLVGLLGMSLRADDPAPQAEAPKRLFVAGGSAGLSSVPTPWKGQELRWTVKSEAGTLGRDVLKSDAQGRLRPRFPVPEVRVAVRLALTIAPQDEPAAARRWEVIALPKDPLADSRKTLQELGVGLLGGGPLAAAVKRSGLTVTELQHDLARSQFKGRVALLGGLLGDSADATRRWIAALPKGACLVVIAGEDGNDPFPMVPWLKAGKPPKKATLHVERTSPIWSDLPVEWLAERLPAAVLAQPKDVLSLRVLGGYVDPDGAVYPLAIETQDAGGRRWLIWSPAWQADRDDPRWDLLLRNSLLWAAQRDAPAADSQPG